MRGLYAVKPWFVRSLQPLEDLLVRRGVTPDALTVAAVVVSILGGALLAVGGAAQEPLLWLLVPPLGIVRLVLNALDGSLARRTGRDRPFGEVLNELGDRVSDAALIVPFIVVVPPVLVVCALVVTGLVSTLGLCGRLSGERLGSGPMGKADRVAVVSLAASLAGVTASETPLQVAAVVILAGGLVTVPIRTRRLHVKLGGARHAR